MTNSPMHIIFPGKLMVGNGSFAQLPGELLQWQPRKVLLATIEPLLANIQPLKAALEAAQVEVLINTAIVAEPSFADFHHIMHEAAAFAPDVVVGIGGGSVLDIAKLIAAQLDNPQTLQEYVGIGLLKGRSKKLVCVPATAGTGSEVSPNAILVDDTDNQKKGIISPYLVPDLVCVDALLTVSVPPAITAATGMDALTHCLEAYTNKFAQPFIDMFALKGIQLIAANIEAAVKDGSDLDAREKVALGSLYGGFCLGPVNTAAVHALSYPLGSMYHLPHGLSNALLLPYVMEYNLVAAPHRYAQVAVALGCDALADNIATAKWGVKKIKALNKACGIPATLQEVGVTKESIPQMAAEAMKIQRLLKNNPRNVTEADAIDIFTNAFA